MKPLGGLGTTAKGVASVSKDKPYENSLGMRFVPVPIRGGPSNKKTVLFSIWETRVQDYEKFIKKDRNHEWPKPDWKQKDDHPAVNVSWDDAVTFCEWLTKEDQRKGKLGKDEHYRLPSDHEWSCAVGLGREEDAEVPPSAKNRKIAVYPWGKKFPPPKGSGNYYGEETKRNPNGDLKPIVGYDDGFDRTAPVGSFEVNKYGVYDMGGNVWEWCQEWFSPIEGRRVLRGGSWLDFNRDRLLSSFRPSDPPAQRSLNYGFRCVVSR